MNKEILIQYIDMQKEVKEIREKNERLKAQINKIEKRIEDIENGETVKDKVRGGLGGLQSFTIEGVPTIEYKKAKRDLFAKKMLYQQRKSTLEELEYDLLKQINEVEVFIGSIRDSHIRRIIRLRCIDGLAWNKVADKIGGGNTEGSVKMAFQRFMEKN